MIFINIVYRIDKKKWLEGQNQKLSIYVNAVYYKHIQFRSKLFFYIVLDFDCGSDLFFAFAVFIRFYFPISLRFHIHSVTHSLSLLFFSILVLQNYVGTFDFEIGFFYSLSSDIHFYYKLSSIHISACLDPASTGQTTQKTQFHLKKLKCTKLLVFLACIRASSYQLVSLQIKSLTFYSIGFIYSLLSIYVYVYVLLPFVLAACVWFFSLYPSYFLIFRGNQHVSLMYQIFINNFTHFFIFILNFGPINQYIQIGRTSHRKSSKCIGVCISHTLINRN